ncbi:hypothetical protein D3C74_409410 [compost metagenome]
MFPKSFIDVDWPVVGDSTVTLKSTGSEIGCSPDCFAALSISAAVAPVTLSMVILILRSSASAPIFFAIAGISRTSAGRS